MSRASAFNTIGGKDAIGVLKTFGVEFDDLDSDIATGPERPEQLRPHGNPQTLEPKEAHSLLVAWYKMLKSSGADLAEQLLDEAADTLSASGP